MNPKEKCKCYNVEGKEIDPVKSIDYFKYLASTNLKSKINGKVNRIVTNLSCCKDCGDYFLWDQVLFGVLPKSFIFRRYKSYLSLEEIEKNLALIDGTTDSEGLEGIVEIRKRVKGFMDSDRD